MGMEVGHLQSLKGSTFYFLAEDGYSVTVVQAGLVLS